MAGEEQRELLWKRVTERWEDDSAHGAFLEHCQRTGTLSDAAARYRGMTGDHTRGPEAQKRLNAVVFLATQAMMAENPAPRRGVPRGLTLAVAAACAVTVIYTLWRVFGG
ncbi:MAG: hypothetical protein EOO75_01215 [Myxococcales bacterium]|nr:MAG: hypothetical protein EOO75_01215 [Myxococcales bacterium]